MVMEFDDEEYGFGSSLPPPMVSLTPFPHSASPSTRRLSSCFTQPREPVRSKRQLAWVSLQGRLVGADEASSSKSIDPNGALGAEEAAAWELFSPIQRVLTVAVVGAAAANSNKDTQISKLQKSVQLRDQVLSSMQEKLDKLCEQVNYFKDQPEVLNQGDVVATKRAECGCKLNNNTSTKVLNGDETIKCEVEPDERRMSDWSDWAPSVTSSLDIQLDSLAFEHDINSLRKECEEKDVAIKELSTYIQSSQVLGSKRVVELEDVIRRKNMIINKLRKDIIVLEQKVMNLTRLRRSSYSPKSSSPSCPPMMSDNVLYDMDNTTDPSSSSDSDSSPKNRTHNLPSKMQETPVVTSDKASKGDLKCVVKSSCWQTPSPRTASPLKENSLSTGTPNTAPLARPRRAMSGGGENRNRRGHAKSKEVGATKRWV